MSSWWDENFVLVIFAVPFLLGLVVGGLMQIYTVSSEKWIKHHTALREDRPVNHFHPTISRREYFQDVPWNGPLTDIVSMVEVKTPQQLWEAYILYWLHLGYIRFVPDSKALQLSTTPPPFGNEMEKELWDMVIEASRGNQFLDPNELFRYFWIHMIPLMGMQQRIKKHSEQEMDRIGMTRIVKRHFLWKSYPALEITSQGQQMVNRCAGLKNYLKDFSLIKNREAVEVSLWDTYMVWAAIFGIAMKAYKGTNTILDVKALFDSQS